MPRQSSLRDFQVYLAERLASATQSAAVEHWLGLRAGAENWLVELPDGGEVVQAAPLTPVPLTRPWFVGLTNVRGALYAVSDLARLRGGEPTVPGTRSRLLLVGSRHGSNVALLVGALQGLKSPQDFQPVARDPGLPAWVAEVFCDAQGSLWYKLAVRDLLADRDFMNIGL